MRRRLNRAIEVISSRLVKNTASPLAVPPPPRTLLSGTVHTSDYDMPRDVARDSALTFAYRIYLSILADDPVGIINDIQSFWGRATLVLEETPDPHDPEPDRYAFVAGVMYLLADAFNHNIELGLPRGAPVIITDEMEDEFKRRPKRREKVPQWAEDARPCAEPLVIPDKNGHLPGKDCRKTDKLLQKKNIVAFEQGIYFI
ncbi:hypothetical protein BDZ85DRAFT_283862 [Elsinoe ampelina]|uniref:Uncharacterized protein n=1 Tax=Elsinoe ampelina TaxID=302913 RepID=A0A6A6G5I3_9PEZI|nr:hypothetical protein BDZ85DRAFT_283862 [Elsinoe ampelina]